MSHPYFWIVIIKYLCGWPKKTDIFFIDQLKYVALWSWYTLTVSPLIFHDKTTCLSEYSKDHLYQDEHKHLWLASSFSLWFWCHLSVTKKGQWKTYNLQALSNVSYYRIPILSKVSKNIYNIIYFYLQNTEITFIIPRYSWLVFFLKPWNKHLNRINYFHGNLSYKGTCHLMEFDKKLLKLIFKTIINKLHIFLRWLNTPTLK